MTAVTARFVFDRTDVSTGEFFALSTNARKFVRCVLFLTQGRLHGSMSCVCVECRAERGRQTNADLGRVVRPPGRLGRRDGVGASDTEISETLRMFSVVCAK